MSNGRVYAVANVPAELAEFAGVGDPILQTAQDLREH
jgi:hypothetical protein